MIEMNMVRIELDGTRNTAMARAIAVFRVRYLATQPASAERDEEVRCLAANSRKALPQTRINAAQERAGLN
jgi:hypothetical protein